MIKIAKQLRAYFEKNNQNIDLPFIHKFPDSCCEVTTLALAFAISKNKLSCTYLVGKGYDRDNDIWHFWIEADGCITDITADQFGKELLFSSKDNWVHKKFADYELIDPIKFVSSSNIFTENFEAFVRIVSSLKI